MSSAADALHLSMQALTHAWRTGHWEELVRFFHPTVVFLAPSASPLCRGSAACVASYQEFSRQAVIHEYAEDAPHVQVVGTTALTATPFRMTYEYEGVMAQEQGTEVLAWVSQEEHWLIIWRMLLSSPRETQP